MGNSKRIEIQTLERAQHEDLTRSAAFGGATLAEVLRGLLNPQRWSLGYPGLTKTFSTTQTPMRADVYQGLLVRPDESNHLLVDPGVIGCVVTTANGDDSSLQVFADPGVTDPGTLLFTANPAGGVRLDIVECQPVDTTLESDTRGIFNETTRVFDPTLVAKVKAPRLNYRIRLGTSGAGLPAMAAGWLPLAVVNVQVGATGFDACDVWDVRPLVADRSSESDTLAGPTGTNRAVRSRVRGISGLQGSQAGAENGHRGHILGSFDGYIAGGEIRESVAVVTASFGSIDHDADFLLGGSQSQAVGGYTAAAGAVEFIAAVFPGGLPRWVRYSQDPDPVVGLRVPRGPRGILLFTTVQPNNVGFYTGLQLPAACGFGAVTAPGIALVASGIWNTGPTFAPTSLRENLTMVGDATAFTVGGKTGVGTNTLVWTFDTTNTSYPKHATELILDLDISADAAELARITVEHKAGVEVFDEPVRIANTAFGVILKRVRIPLWTGEITGEDTGMTIVKITGSAAAIDAVAKVAGWVTP